jgi:hypothetical protein
MHRNPVALALLYHRQRLETTGAEAKQIICSTASSGFWPDRILIATRPEI